MPLKNLDWSRWLYGLLSGFIGGGAGAVTAGLGAMGLAPQTFNLQAGLGDTLKLLAICFVINGIINAFFFLKQSPLPPEEKDEGGS